MHDLETAKELLDRSVKDGINEYFEFIRHRLEDAVNALDHAENTFEKNGDYHVVGDLVQYLSVLDMGHSRAIKLVHKVSMLHEEVFILEEQERNNDEEI